MWFDNFRCNSSTIVHVISSDKCPNRDSIRQNGSFFIQGSRIDRCYPQRPHKKLHQITDIVTHSLHGKNLLEKGVCGGAHVKYHVFRGKGWQRSMGWMFRTGTAALPPVPKGLYAECRKDYLKRYIKQYKILLNCFQLCSDPIIKRFQPANQLWLKSNLKGMTDRRTITLTVVDSPFK